MNHWDDDWDKFFSVHTPTPPLQEPQQTPWDSFDFAVDDEEVSGLEKPLPAPEVRTGGADAGACTGLFRTGRQTEEKAPGWASGQPDSLSTEKSVPSCVQFGLEQREERSAELNNQASVVMGASTPLSAAPHYERQYVVSGNELEGQVEAAGVDVSGPGNDMCEDPDVAFFNSLGDDNQNVVPALGQDLEPVKNGLGQSKAYANASVVPREHHQNYSQIVNGMQSNDNNCLAPVDDSSQVLQTRSINSVDNSHQRQSSSFQNRCHPEALSPRALETVDDAAFFDMLGDIADGTITDSVLENQAPSQIASPHQPNSASDPGQWPLLHLPSASPTFGVDGYAANNTKGFPEQYGGRAYDGGHQTFGPFHSNPQLDAHSNHTEYAPQNPEMHNYTCPSFDHQSRIVPGLNGYSSQPEGFQPIGIPPAPPTWNPQNEMSMKHPARGVEAAAQIPQQGPISTYSNWQLNSGPGPFYQPPGPMEPSFHNRSLSGGAHFETKPVNSSIPRTRQIHGRPPCPVINFGIGGKVVVMLPKVDATNSSAGLIEVHSLKSLPSILSQRQRETGLDMPNGVLDPTRAALEHFPGPLGSSTNKEKLISYISDRMEYCSQEEPDHPDSVGLKTLWGTLRLMTRHPGFIVDRTGKSYPTASEEFVDMLSTCSTWDSSFSGRAYVEQFSHEEKNPQELESVVQQVQLLSSIGNIAEALKVAKSGQLWDIALVLAQFLGQKAFSETAAEMATKRLSLDSPLNTLVQLVAGKPETLIGTRGSQRQKLDHVDGNIQCDLPTAGSQIATPSLGQKADSWQGHLAILAANRGASRKELATSIGDRLVNQEEKVCAGHLFYLTGGLMPQSFDEKNSCRFGLLGWDHRTSSFPSMAAFQCSEILEWLNGATNPSGKIVALQPYKLLYAWTLAEYGYMSEAADYCELILEVIKSLGNRMPKSLLICAASAKELLNRVQQFAAAHKVTLKRSATLLESFGRILDKGINKLIGVGEGQIPDDSLSRKSSVSDGRTPSEVVSGYMRSPSQASFDSSRNVPEEYRQRLSPRPPLASYPNYSYQQPAEVPTPWSASPSPRGHYTPQRKSFSSQSFEYYGGPGTTHNAQHIPAHSPNPQDASDDKKGGWLRMLWGGGNHSKKSSQSDSPNKQAPDRMNKDAFFSGTWGANGGEGRLATQDALPPSTLLSWGNDSADCGLQGPQARLSSAGACAGNGYVDGYRHESATYSGSASASSTPKIQASQPTLQSFYFPQAPGTNGSDFEEIAL